ncbi:MAG: eukaryotic-like serine/threonine-protein kinase, partial [Pseudomonadota bacterium]|nr:eukaryotic-like serine/threonine-protein kinase [Pseudomonadota bacterium]
MSFFTNMRAERLIADVKAAGDADSPAARKAIEKLGQLGPSAIPKIVDALANADKQETAAFVGVLASLLDNKSLPAVVAGLNDGNQRTVAALTWALSSSRGYSPQLLLAMLEDPAVPKGPIVSALAAHKTRLGAREVLKYAYSQEPAEKAALFRIIADIADASLVPELVSRLEGKDPIARTHIINILSR